MYISIKLPPAFGSFNRLRKENYPFNNLFTAYLAAVSRLGLAMEMDVEELVGYIEDSIFEGQRLPDVPEGNEPVNLRYKTDDPDVVKYIGGSIHTNRMAVMYIARMTLRLSVAYGTSLFRLTRLINDLGSSAGTQKVSRKSKEPVRREGIKTEEKPVPVPKPERERLPEKKPEQEQEMEEMVPGPRVSNRSAVPPVPVPEAKPSTTSASVEAARAAISELAELTAATAEQDDSDNEKPIVETNPYLDQFFKP